MALDREVLILQPVSERSGTRIWDCQRSDWSIIRHSNLDTAGAYLTSSGTSVAILDCRGIESPGQKLKRWMDGHQGVYWVAILSPNQLLKEEWQLFVATYCYDYHTSPVIDNMLAITLGRAYGMSRIKGSLSLTFEKQGLIGNHEDFQNVLIFLQSFRGHCLTLVGERGVGKELIARCLADIKGCCFICVDAAKDSNSEFLSDLCDAPNCKSSDGICLYLFNADEASDSMQHLIASQSYSEHFLVIYGFGKPIDAVDDKSRWNPGFLVALKSNLIKVPPLRERGKDKLLIAKHYLQKIGRERGKFMSGFTSQAEEAIERYHWPGNVDELIERVRAGVEHCHSEHLSAEVMGMAKLIRVKESDFSLRRAREEADALAIERVLELVSGSTGKAAELLCISRASLHRLIARYGIRR
ncbi:VpsR-related response regulator [Oceanimonas pelagia]|uniref:VpsR-related response regulator n=1 Tax=Oceanimonas pelagia TaxID=3028314 RepID=A0AA50QC21_9GAMM|nr:VpsR-related response regulator [Oceanimonas pelagia]WMC10822.1 VpsR-related response regulator [Oceanimonas pelagia]